MLKWAVNNGSIRSTYLPLTPNEGLTATPTSNAPTVATPHVSSRRTLSMLRRQRLKRKASSVMDLIENYKDDKPQDQKIDQKWNIDQGTGKQEQKQDNCFHASTPLSKQTCSRLSDDRWRTPHWIYLQDNGLEMEQSHSIRCPSSNGRQHYSRTLPTFDIEYSPSGGQDVYHQQEEEKLMVPGPILALRGVADIPDSYFKKPRYLDKIEFKNNDELTTEENEQITLETKTLQLNSNFKNKNKRIISSLNNNDYRLSSIIDNQNNSLSSSRMGDVTLERMIDSILESTRKERKPLTKRYQIMSPTYTAADDPASDLQEIWENNNNFGEEDYNRCQQQIEECGELQIYTNLNKEGLKDNGNKPSYQENLKKKSLFKEDFQDEPIQLKRPRTDIDFIKKKYIGLSSASRKWQRQPALRRKRRKLSQITDTLRNSAHRLLRKELLDETENVPQDKENKENDNLPENLSPDSGHNSGSEYENEEDQLIDDRRELLSKLETITPNR